MHLAIETVGTKHSGGATVINEVLASLADDLRFERITIYASPRSDRTFEFPEVPRMRVCERPIEEASYARRVVWYVSRLAQQCRADRVDVILCANGMGDAGRLLPRVAMVQQALPYSDEALACLPAAQRVRMHVIRTLTCRHVRSADAVVAQSAAMIETLRWRCRLQGKRTAVCQPAGSALPQVDDPALRDRMEASPEGLRLLYVGNTAPYKNVARVARAMGRLRLAMPGATLFATCGADDPICAVEGVVALGYLDRRSLATAYRMATVVVQPSLIESGPLVPPEAMHAGRPLLAAERPWARDACRDAALYFDPYSEGDFVRQASALLANAELRHALVRNAAAVMDRRLREASYANLADVLLWAGTPAAQLDSGSSHV